MSLVAQGRGVYGWSTAARFSKHRRDCLCCCSGGCDEQLRYLSCVWGEIVGVFALGYP